MEQISCPYKPRSRDPTLIFGPLDICSVNHRPPVGLCLTITRIEELENIWQIWMKWQSGLENMYKVKQDYISIKSMTTHD